MARRAAARQSGSRAPVTIFPLGRQKATTSPGYRASVSAFLERGSRGRKWLIRLLILVAVLPVTFIGITQTRWGRDRMRELAIAAIHDEAGLRATLGDVAVDPWPLTVVARDIELDDPVYGRFADAAVLRIQPSIGALLQGKLDLDSIEIERPTIHLIVREGEIRNLPRVQGGGSDELPFGELSVTRARIVVDADPFARAELRGVSLAIEADGDEADVSVRCERGTVTHLRGTERLQRLLGDLHVAPGGIEIRSLALRTPHFRARIDDAVVPLPLSNTWRGTVEAHVDLAHLRELPTGWEIPDVAGHVSVHGDVRSDPTGIRGHGSLQARGARIEQWGLGDVTIAEVDATPERIRLRGGEARLIRDGGRVEIEGEIGLGAGHPVDARTRLHDVSFARLMDQLGVTPNAIVEWMLSGEARLRGTLEPLRLDGPIRTQTHGFLVTRDAWHARPQRPVVAVSRASVNGRWSVRPDALRFDGLEADLPHTQMSGSVMLGFGEDIRVTVRSEHVDLRDASPLVDFPIGGVGTANVDVTGTFSDPVVRGHVAFRDFSFNTFTLGNLESDAQLEHDGLAVRFPEVVAQKFDSRYHVRDLFMDFREPGLSITGTLATERFVLADLYHVFHYEDDERFLPFQGVVRGESQMSYTFGKPGDSPTGTLEVGMDLAIPEAVLNGFAFTDGRFVGRWRWLRYEQGYRGGELDVEHLALHKGRGTLTVTGRMALGGGLRFTASGDQLDVRDTEGLHDRFPDLSGIYDVVADIGGTMEIPRAHLDVTVAGLAHGDTHLGDGRAYVRMTDGQDPWVSEALAWDERRPPDLPCARARLGLARGHWRADPPLRTVDGPQPRLERPMAYLICGDALGGQVRVDLAIGRTQVYPLRGQVELAGLVLDPFLPEGGAGEPLRGSVAGRISFRGGAMLEDDSLVGRMRLSRLHVAQRDVELRNDGVVDVSFDRGAFQIHHAAFEGPGSRLSVTGTGSRRAGVAVTMDGQLDLGLLATMSDTLTEADGSVALRVNVSGALHDPAVFGEADVSGGRFRFASFTEPISDLNGRITFSERRVLLDAFHARFAGGTVALDGSATLRDRAIEHYEVRVSARDLSLAPDEHLDVGLDADGALVWSTGDRLPRLEGEVALTRLLYTRPIDIGASIGQLSRSQRVEVEPYDPEEDRLALDLRVLQRAPIRIDNELIQAEGRIEDEQRPFRIVGTDQRFGVLGDLAITRGVVHLRDVDFRLRRGTISFDDESRIDPRFSITAQTEITRPGDLAASSWRIQLDAQGSRDAFRLDMSSEPELSQEDIVLLLTLRMTRAEMDQLQTGNVTGGAALEALGAASGVEREVRRAVGVIDEFRVGSAYSERSNTTVPQLSIGRRLTDRVRFTASTALGENREVRTGVEVQTGENTRVEAVYDNNDTTGTASLGNVGVDLRWRLEFE